MVRAVVIDADSVDLVVVQRSGSNCEERSTNVKFAEVSVVGVRLPSREAQSGGGDWQVRVLVQATVVTGREPDKPSGPGHGSPKADFCEEVG